MAEHKEKNELIGQLESELAGYRDLEKNYCELDIKYEESLAQKRSMLKVQRLPLKYSRNWKISRAGTKS